MQGIINALINPGASFDETLAYINAFFDAFETNPGVIKLWDMFYSLPFIHTLSLAVCLTVAFFGKKIFSLLRFLYFLVIGYAVGLVIVAPILIPIMPMLPDWVVGLVIGFISAIVSKVLYYVVLGLIVRYAVHLALLPLLSELIWLIMIVSFIIAVGAVVLIFKLRKYVEIIITSGLGAWAFAIALTVWWDYTKLGFLDGIEWLGIMIVTLVVGAFGFIVQFKMRERY